jgi:hypothetical protein
LKSLEKKLESLGVKSDPKKEQRPEEQRLEEQRPEEQRPEAAPVIVNLSRGSDHARRHRRGLSSSPSSDSSEDSASTAPKAKRNAGLKVNAKKRLREELDDEARLGSAPQMEIEHSTEWLDVDGSEMPSSDLSKAKHEASNEIFYIA